MQIGSRALPALIKHLSDKRETKFVEDHSVGGVAMWFTIEYDPRTSDPQHRPAGVNQARGMDRAQLVPNKKYTLKVGDLCFVAVGQIVNRDLEAMRYQPTAQEYINSPVHTPALARAVAKDWDGLTADAHRKQLEDDATRYWPSAGAEAVKRLLYYYPADGERIALELLNRRSDAFFAEQLLVDALRNFPNRRIDAAVQNLFARSIRQPKVGSGITGNTFHQYYLDALAEACAGRMKGKGFDPAYLAYFEHRVDEVERTPTTAPERNELDKLKSWVKELGGDGAVSSR